MQTPQTKIFDMAHIIDFLNLLDDESFVASTKQCQFLNCPLGFDIETTSFYDDCGDKQATMYIWTFGLRFNLIQGRSWEDLQVLLDALAAKLNLSENRRAIVYVENFEFEFQFMRKYFKWAKVFAISERSPLYAITSTGIEFRCAYKLSGYSLATIAKNLQKWNVRKLLGDLDYSKPRHRQTPLMDSEKEYTYNDVIIITAYIDECIEAEGSIVGIPLTATGYVRRYTRKKCLRNNASYFHTIQNLKITPEIYSMLKDAFQGGFVHASAFQCGKHLQNVASQDETSAYPAALCREKYPMSAGELIKITSSEMLKMNLNLYCCLFEVHFEKIKSKTIIDNPLSASKCRNLLYPAIDNGRIFSADELDTTITEQDFFILNQFYEWRGMKIGRFYRFKKAYLPAPLIDSILSLYESKTKLKGVRGKEAEYTHSKGLLNSLYGMMVTDICRPVYGYDYDSNRWLQTSEPDEVCEIAKYNSARARFLFYPWGVWCTAYARRALFDAILESGTDHVYSDTDAEKYLHPDKHRAYYETANRKNREKLLAMCRARGIDPARIEPTTADGKKKLLGAWEYEGEYSDFKTLGAKRYLTCKAGNFSMTVSGLSKIDAIKWLSDTCAGDVTRIFAAFSDNLDVPASATGKLTHTYIDSPRSGVLVDYLGTPAPWDSRSSIHLEGAEYHMMLSKCYRDFLLGTRDVYK